MLVRGVAKIVRRQDMTEAAFDVTPILNLDFLPRRGVTA